MLANIIQPENIKDLCSRLVVVSAEAAKALAGFGYIQKSIFLFFSARYLCILSHFCSLFIYYLCVVSQLKGHYEVEP